MKLTKKEIKEYEKEGFLVEKIKDAIKEMEKIPKEELSPGLIVGLAMLRSNDPEEYTISPEISFSEIKSYYFDTTKYIDVCPNDNKTKLPPSRVGGKDLNGEYSEYVRCPDCWCLIERRPSDEAIKEYESRPPIRIRSDISQIVN